MKLDIDFMITAFFESVKKLPVNLELTFIPFVIGLLIAIGIAAVRAHNIKAVARLVDFYISFVRGTPVLLQIYLCFYGLPLLVDYMARWIGSDFRANSLSAIFLVLIALTLNISVYLSESIRGGISAIPKGEIDAAYSLGMTNLQVLKRVILPQAVVICLPNFCTLLIGALHSSVLVFYVTLVDMNAMGKILSQDNWLYFESFMAVGFGFWIVTASIELVFHALEKILTANKKAIY